MWSNWLPRPTLTRIVERAITRLRAAKTLWAKVAGQGADFIDSAWRLGWRVEGPCTVVTDNGRTLELQRDLPAFVKGEIAAPVRWWRWWKVTERVQALGEGGNNMGAFRQPIYKLLNSTGQEDDWGPTQRAGVKSAFTNRQWPHSRLHQAGLADSPLSQLCVS